jgi:hypothetical protein
MGVRTARTLCGHHYNYHTVADETTQSSRDNYKRNTYGSFNIIETKIGTFYFKKANLSKLACHTISQLKRKNFQRIIIAR